MSHTDPIDDLSDFMDKTENETPRPLRRELPPATPYPVPALHKLQDAAEAIHDKTQAPLAICAQSVLAAATLAVQAHVDIALPSGQIKPIGNNYMTIAASGERKSASDTLALCPIHRYEAKLRKTYDANLPAYQNAREAWDKARDDAKKKHKGNFEAIKNAMDAVGLPPVAPCFPMMICTEPTFEGLCRLYMGGLPSLGIFSAEGGQFIGGHGMSDENKLRTSSGLSLLWDGDPIRRVRAGDGSIVLPGRRCSVHLMAQENVAAAMLSDPLLLDQGLLSRFLVTYPDSAIGTRFWHEPAPDTEAKLIAYESLLLAALEHPLPLAEGKINELNPRVLPLNSIARNDWIKYADHIERQCAEGGQFEQIRGIANKLPEHAARMAGVLALIFDPQIGTIESSCMAAGIELANHYANEALRLFGASRINPDIVVAEKLLHWLVTSWQDDHVSLPDIYQRGLNAIGDKATAHRIVTILEEHGYLKRIKSGGIIRGQFRREVWAVYKG